MVRGVVGLGDAGGPGLAWPVRLQGLGSRVEPTLSRMVKRKEGQPLTWLWWILHAEDGRQFLRGS